MGLDVETPDPPDLTNRPLPSELDPEEVLDGTVDLRREELEEILRDGAWSEAFQEWAEYTDLTETEYRTVHEAGLLELLDVYWDPMGNEVRFEVPGVPRELAGREDLGSQATAELTDLGRTVVETIEDAYVDWGAEDEGEDAWSEETASDETPLEDG
ncbi:hypothetical protein [Natronomonas marina]|jgi:hypothetical protein|uniref:hypothetical protein n=1 Tax=Natronomonas marina TaxID=2961939 RepID=UPI0020CA1F8B|nr:hypothetical protein [Natronomonas marina]